MEIPMIRNHSISIFLLLVLGTSTGCAELQRLDLQGILEATTPLDQSTVARGLKEALAVGTRRTTQTLSAAGAFRDNPRLRLKLPGELGSLARMLRNVGFSAQVDALEDSMNRAAEEAAANAVPVFASAISSMSITDAFAILNGAEDSATTYFRERTSAKLSARFSPIAKSAMEEVGFYSIYKELMVRYRQIPFTKPPAIDLEDYVANQTMAALFGELAKQEARIREDPAARSSALLRRVFGATNGSALERGR